MALSRRHAGDGVRHRPLCLTAGWLVLAVALISPLCNLTSALFSARVAQHLLVIQVAAPLFVLAWPPAAIRWPGWFRALARPFGSPEIWDAFGLFLWLWHLPGPYMAALARDAVLWTMHGMLFAGADQVQRVPAEVAGVGVDAPGHAEQAAHTKAGKC